MSNEELLKVRYKVVADYPHSQFKIGDILSVEFTGILSPKPIGNYPHLFKKLEWWEDRTDDEMPEYVKWDVNGETRFLRLTGNFNGKSYKCIYLRDNSNGEVELTEGDLPSTKEEYESYITHTSLK